jgi:hypothetical protein
MKRGTTKLNRNPEAPLSVSNPYLRNDEMERVLTERSVRSSSAMEGIYVGVCEEGPGLSPPRGPEDSTDR